jgi:hypothetical protein
MSYQGAGRPLLLHMRHRRHEEAGAHGTRLITAALVLTVGALSLAAVTPLLCLPDEPCDATREYAAWRFDR